MKLPDTSPSTPSLHYPPLREWQLRIPGHRDRPFRSIVTDHSGPT